MAIWDKQALVFVNEKANKTAQLIAFRDAIVQARRPVVHCPLQGKCA
jgi:hypothetical protein